MGQPTAGNPVNIAPGTHQPTVREGTDVGARERVAARRLSLPAAILQGEGQGLSHTCITTMTVAASAARREETGRLRRVRRKPPMLSLHTGYDTSYLTKAVGEGAAATDYYTGAKGEPPGYWQGTGAAALGLAGQADAEGMRRLCHEDTGPDGQVLARRQRPGTPPAAG